MIIDILTVGGSPDNVTPPMIYERGVGGAELALISWAEVMADRGHNIKIFNQTGGMNYQQSRGTRDNLTTVQYLQKAAFNPFDKNRDILLTFRGPNQFTANSDAKKKIGWSCDQMTIGNYVDWYREMDAISVISSFHKNDHLERYGKIAEKAKVIDLGVRTWEYTEDHKTYSKVPYQFIYCSVPDRGLNELAYIWPRIKTILPEATLIITSDYTLWGAHEPLNTQYRLKFAGMKGVNFVGNVNRNQLVKYQMESEVQIYPCIYDENFCIANAECQVAGCHTITSDRGALFTTNITGVFGDIQNLDSFVDRVHEFYQLTKDERQQTFFENSSISRKYFDWNKICEEWEELFND